MPGLSTNLLVVRTAAHISGRIFRRNFKNSKLSKVVTLFQISNSALKCKNSQSRDIDQCYKSFRNDLGKSDDRFLDAFKTATTSLLDIDDALNELKMIKRVYQNQAQVWEDLHKDRTLAMDCGCTQDQAPRRLYTMMTRLEEDAHSVRESVSYSRDP